MNKRPIEKLEWDFQWKKHYFYFLYFFVAFRKCLPSCLVRGLFRWKFHLIFTITLQWTPYSLRQLSRVCFTLNSPHSAEWIWILLDTSFQTDIVELLLHVDQVGFYSFNDSCAQLNIGKLRFTMMERVVISIQLPCI